MKAPRARLSAGRSSIRTIERREIAVEIRIEPRAANDDRLRTGRDAWRRVGLSGLPGLCSRDAASWRTLVAVMAMLVRRRRRTCNRM